jgi:hypothetical protein
MKVWKVVKRVDDMRISAVVGGNLQEVYFNGIPIKVNHGLCFNSEAAANEFADRESLDDKTIEVWEASVKWGKYVNSMADYCELERTIDGKKISDVLLKAVVRDKHTYTFTRERRYKKYLYAMWISPVGSMYCTSIWLKKLAGAYKQHFVIVDYDHGLGAEYVVNNDC